MYNNTHLIYSLVCELDSTPLTSRSSPRRRCTSEPVLLPSYPSTGVLQREAEQDADKALSKRLVEISLEPPTDEQIVEPRRRRASSTSSSSTSPPTSPINTVKGANGSTKPWKEPQSFEVLRAVERKDVMYLMEVRDRAFHLLLRKTGDATPLLHSMRIGASHREVSIVLLGAFSRWVNNLEDDQMHLPRTRTLLKSLRTNLKLAIDYGVITLQSDLIASFLQTLIMSEGDRWVRTQAHSVGLALKTQTAGRPVETAQTAVRSFATKQLGKADMIASLEDYISNATLDLLLMGAWSLVAEHVKVDPIPTYVFARDNRVYQYFCDGMDSHKTAIKSKTGKRLRWQLNVLRTTLEGRSTSYRHKVETLGGILDIDGLEG